MSSYNRKGGNRSANGSYDSYERSANRKGGSRSANDGLLWKPVRKTEEKIVGASDSTSSSQNLNASVVTEPVVKDVGIDVNSLKETPSSPVADSNSKNVKQFGDKPQKDGDNGELNNSNHSNQQAIGFDICPKKVNSAVKLKPPLHVTNKQKRILNEQSLKGPNIEILGPGMVLMKGYISFEDQISIVKTCAELGNGEGGFYQPSYSWGNKLHLKMMCLGKNWDPESLYTEFRPVDNTKPPVIPDKFRDMVVKAIRDSNEFIRGRDAESDRRETIPSMSPDICIINFYTQNGRLGLHQDKDESTSSLSAGLPVVSFSLGDTADFLYGETRSVDEAKSVKLKSGDVLIFGGKSRMIYHGVPSISPGTAPVPLLEATNMREGRLNLTFRRY